ncbi:FMN-binding negative transcriptional regulator [Jejudonia soesokkakensis]|uniref:FMN-binding negative transcriptional regulator n=1 Tax=Jejudonia soesokkakensis TaxID=1323432 RepID=A0ABW2MVC2_9FLAO
MYPPSHHQSQDIQKMIAVIKNYPLGMLVSAKNDEPFITHIPIIYNDKSGKLVAHIDKFNPQVETLVDGADVTVVFKGPDTYISPSIYTTQQLPTWNYIIVHVKGTISLINEPEAAKNTMIAMTEFLEQPDQKYILDKENKSMDRFVNYIQAFDITITNWEGKFKLSQDKNAQDYENAKQELLKNTPSTKRVFIEEIYL